MQRTTGILFAVLTAGSAMAERIPVAIAQPLVDFYPDMVREVRERLDRSGLPLDYHQVPSARGLHGFRTGEYHVDLFRADVAMESSPDAIRIEPAVLQLQFHRVVAAQHPELCALSDDKLTGYRVTGLLGSELYERYVYPLFGHKDRVRTPVQALSMLQLDRTDFTAMPLEVLEQLRQTPETRALVEATLACDRPPLVSMSFYVFVSGRYPELARSITEALRR